MYVSMQDLNAHTSALSFMALESTSIYHCMFSGTTLFSLTSSSCNDLSKAPRLPDSIAWLTLDTAVRTGEGRRKNGG